MKETKNFRIQLTTDLLGTVSKDPAVYKEYIESKKPKGVTEDEAANIQNALEKTEMKGWTGFMFDNEKKELFIYNYMIKGFLKAAGNTLKETEEVKIKALRSKIDDFVFINPRRIFLGQSEPDDVNERPIRVMTMQGPRVALIRSDVIKAGKILEFEITLIQHKELSWDTIDKLLAHGEFMGLGQFRNGGYGQFKVL